MEAEPTKADPPERTRRRFQFRLRTLMIVVTLLCVVGGYVAHEARIVRDRQAWLSEQDKRELEFQKDWFAALDKNRFKTETFIELPETAKTLTDGRGTGGPSFIRRWLGDLCYDQIAVIAPVNDDECRRAVELFPESLVIVIEHHQ